MHHEPHFVRFTRALAIAAAFAACGGSTSEPSEPSPDGDSRRDPTEITDASRAADASHERSAVPEPLKDAEPPFDSGGASGPLCPPDLPATFA